MKKELELQKFIREHSEWEKILQEKPYCITISRDTWNGLNLIMFKYNQIESDFKNPIVRECRGLILNEDNFETVCVPFFKFGNYGESYCPEIDWSSCWVQQKIDGSLIKIVRIGNDILVSTNGTIDAFKAPLAEQIGCTAKSFGELATEAIVEAFYDKIDWDGFGLPLYHETVERECVGFLKSFLDEGKTYMFELTSPFNKVVVTWHETRLNFLGFRDNFTLQETCFEDHELKNYFKTPEIFPMRNLEECVKAAEKLDCNNEGFVVCDRNFNRVKVKSPTYVSLHHMKNNGILSYERGLDIVRGNELEEVLTYFPEFKEHLEKIKDDYHNLQKFLTEAYNRYLMYADALDTRKEHALAIQKEFGKYSGCGFALLDNKVKDENEWLEKVTSKNIVKYLGYKE